MAGPTPFTVHGAALALGLILWYLPELYNYWNRASRAIFPEELSSHSSLNEGSVRSDHSNALEDEQGDGEGGDDYDGVDVESPSKPRRINGGGDGDGDGDGEEETRPADGVDEDGDGTGEQQHEQPNATLSLLATYINSVLGLDRGVFSEDSFGARLFYEWSLHNSYTAVLRPEINGPYGVMVERRHRAASVVPLSSPGRRGNNSSDSKLDSAGGDLSDHDHDAHSHDASSGGGHLALSTGAWNRLVRAMRVVTSLNVAFTVLGLLYFNQYPNVTPTTATTCAALTTQLQCLSQKISFLDTVTYCSHDATSGLCSGNTNPDFSMQFLVLSTLLAALVVAPLQWPLEAVFGTLLVFPKVERPAFCHLAPSNHDDHAGGGGSGSGVDHSENAVMHTDVEDEDELIAVALEATMGYTIENHEDDVTFTSCCPAVDNARRHRRLQRLFQQGENRRNHDVLLSSLEMGEALTRLISEADKDVVAKLYQSFPISQLHPLRDKSMRKLVELLALFEAIKNFRSTMQVGAVRSAFDQQWGIVPSADDPEDFYLIGKSMLVRDDQTTFYDIILMHCFNGAENYVDVSEVEVRMAEAKQTAQDVSRRIATAQLQDHVENSTAFELIRLFGLDIMGGCQSIAGRVYKAKSGEAFPFTIDAWLVARSLHLGAWAVVLLTNATAVAISMGVFSKTTATWSYGWFIACCMHLLLDFLVYETCGGIFSAFVVPDQVRSTVRHSLMLAAPVIEYLWASSENADAPLPPGMTADDLTQTTLCVPKFLYASRKLADKLPHGFEGELLRRFNTAWVVPALRPVAAASSAGGLGADGDDGMGSGGLSAAFAAAAAGSKGRDGEVGSGVNVRDYFAALDKKAASASASTPSSTGLPLTPQKPDSHLQQLQLQQQRDPYSSSFTPADEAYWNSEENNYEDADVLMGAAFNESDSFMRYFVLRLGSMPSGAQRLLVNWTQQVLALIIGYAVFSTNPSAPIAGAAITYAVLGIAAAVFFVSPYLPLPSARTLYLAVVPRFLQDCWGPASKLPASVSPAPGDGDEGMDGEGGLRSGGFEPTALEDLMLKALERAARLLDDDLYLRQRAAPGRGSSALGSSSSSQAHPGSSGTGGDETEDESDTEGGDSRGGTQASGSRPISTQEAPASARAPAAAAAAATAATPAAASDAGTPLSFGAMFSTKVAPASGAAGSPGPLTTPLSLSSLSRKAATQVAPEPGQLFSARLRPDQPTPGAANQQQQQQQQWPSAAAGGASLNLSQSAKARVVGALGMGFEDGSGLFDELDARRSEDDAWKQQQALGLGLGQRQQQQAGPGQGMGQSPARIGPGTGSTIVGPSLESDLAMQQYGSRDVWNQEDDNEGLALGQNLQQIAGNWGFKREEALQRQQQALADARAAAAAKAKAAAEAKEAAAIAAREAAVLTPSRSQLQLEAERARDEAEEQERVRQMYERRLKLQERRQQLDAELGLGLGLGAGGAGSAAAAMWPTPDARSRQQTSPDPRRSAEAEAEDRRQRELEEEYEREEQEMIRTLKGGSALAAAASMGMSRKVRDGNSPVAISPEEMQRRAAVQRAEMAEQAEANEKDAAVLAALEAAAAAAAAEAKAEAEAEAKAKAQVEAAARAQAQAQAQAVDKHKQQQQLKVEESRNTRGPAMMNFKSKEEDDEDEGEDGDGRKSRKSTKPKPSKKSTANDDEDEDEDNDGGDAGEEEDDGEGSEIEDISDEDEDEDLDDDDGHNIMMRSVKSHFKVRKAVSAKTHWKSAGGLMSKLRVGKAGGGPTKSTKVKKVRDLFINMLAPSSPAPAPAPALSPAPAAAPAPAPVLSPVPVSTPALSPAPVSTPVAFSAPASAAATPAPGSPEAMEAQIKQLQAQLEQQRLQAQIEALQAQLKQQQSPS